MVTACVLTCAYTINSNVTLLFSLNQEVSQCICTVLMYLVHKLCIYILSRKGWCMYNTYFLSDSGQLFLHALQHHAH